MNTKLDTAVLVAKGGCFLIIGFFTPLVSGLAQWANSGEWPGKIVWVVMAGTCCVGGATQLLSFLSNSFSDYKDNVTPAKPVETPKP